MWISVTYLLFSVDNCLPIHAAKGHEVFVTWWWAEAMSWVFGLCNYGHSWMPTTLPWNTRILWRFKYESRAANSNALGRETSSEWGHGGRKECKCHCIYNVIMLKCAFISFHFHSPNIIKLVFINSWAGSSSYAWNQRTLLVRRTDCYHCKNFFPKILS